MINNSALSNERRLDEQLSLSRCGDTRVCTECNENIKGNEYIWYNTFRRTVRHKRCHSNIGVDNE